MKKQKTSPDSQRWHGFPYDHIAKALFHLIPSALVLFDVPGTRKRMVSVEVSKDHQPYFLDVLVEIILDRASRLYRAVRRRARPVLVHVEAISQFHWDIALRMIEYRPAILRKHGLNSLVLPYILVMGRPPARDRVDSVSEGWDRDGKETHTPVLYLGLLEFDRLPEDEQNLPAAQIFAILKEDTLTEAAMRRAVKVLTTITDEAELVACRNLLVAFAMIKAGGLQMLAWMQQEDGLMERLRNLTAEDRAALEGFIKFYQEVPAYHDFWEATVWAPARAEGLEKGLEKGREEGREEGQQGMLVNNLLEALAAKSMRLTQTQAAQLRRMPFDELPSIKVAIEATSAADFAKRAGLNGRLNGTGRR